MIPDKKIELCRLYENVSKTGKRYLVGNLSFTTKLLILPNEPKESEPQWTAWVVEKLPRAKC